MGESEALTADDRIMVAGTCAECGSGYTMVMRACWTWEPIGYCRKACEKKAYVRRKAERCPACQQPDRKPGRAVCGRCLLTAAGMCKGKRRLSEPKANEVEQRYGRLAVWCRCCGWWHNTSRPVADQQALILQVGEILEAMRKEKGQPWVNELIESWDPSQFDRKTWSPTSV
jgi:hypothetical protein